MPTVILAKTVKGYGMGAAGEALNPTHGTKKMDDEDVRAFRDRFQIPISGRAAGRRKVPFFHPGEKSPEVEYMHERRKALGGFLPQRRRKSTQSLEAPKLAVYERLLKTTGEREISTTMAFVQALNITLRDKQVGPRCVPIVADEARTFGMEGMFRQLGIYAPLGQKYKPVDRDQLMYYREDADRPGAGGRHHRGRRVLLVDGLRHQLQHQRPAADAVLHLLLDVRLPAHRRQRLAGGGHALARLPARRHRRPHHAQRRRPAARGRPEHGAGRARSPTAAATTRPSATRSR